MAQNHESAAAELHATLQERTGSVGEKRMSVDMTGGALPTSEKTDLHDVDVQETEEGLEPTEQERKTLRRVGDAFPKSAFLVAAVELCERFTCTFSVDHAPFLLSCHTIRACADLNSQTMAAKVSSRTTSTTALMALTELVVWVWVTPVPRALTCSSNFSVTLHPSWEPSSPTSTSANTRRS